MQAVGVHEVGGGATVHGGGLVHQLHESVHGAADGFGNQVRAFVGRAHEGAVEQIPEVDALADFQIHDRVAVLNAPHGRVAEVHSLAHVAHHEAQQHGEDFGGGGGIHHRVGVLFKDDIAGLGLDEDGGLGVELILVKVFGMLGVVGIGVAGNGGRDVAHHLFSHGAYGNRERARKQHSQHKAQAAREPFMACRHGSSSRFGWFGMTAFGAKRHKGTS